MRRRNFLQATLGFLGLSGVMAKKPLVAQPHTDFLYATVDGPGVLSPDAHPVPSLDIARRNSCYAYVDGEMVPCAQRANALEGWVEYFEWTNEGQVVHQRREGVVQLLWYTPQRYAEHNRLVASLRKDG